MKTRIIIFLLFVGFMIIASFGSIFFYYNSAESVLIEQTNEYFEAIAQSRASHIESFLESKKDRAIDFSSDGFIKNSLKELKANPSEEVMQELSEHLIKNKIVVDESFYEVFVLDVNGKVVATTNLEEEFGDDLSNDSLFSEGKNVPYFKEPFYDEEFKTNGIVVSAPIFDKKEFLGVVAIRVYLDSLGGIITDKTGLGETGEIYLINKEGYMITPSRFFPEEQTFLKQKVDSVNSRDCFGMGEMEITEHKGHEPVNVFEDYRGVEVLGTHAYIPEMQWCLLAEIEEREAIGLLRNELLKSALLILIITTIIMGIFVLISSRLILRKKGKK